MELVDPDFPRKPKVLIADDDWLNRDLLENYLARMGAEVVSTTDGFKAVELAVGDPPDLILMDMQMPRMDGLEACKHLKAHPSTQFVPLVIITAMEGDEEKIKALEAGADDFITKPFSSFLLMTRLRALLKIKQLNDQLQDRNRLLHKVLSRYLAPEVTDTILTDPEKHLRLGGEVRLVTVLFTDLRGFTDFTAKHTAAEVVETLNRVLSELTQVVFKHHGTFDKYLGDGLMAFYGAPLSSPDDPLRAVRTALEMQAVFEKLRAAPGSLLDELRLGIGLHSGEATVGNIGSERMMDYTVIGDTVNLAERLTEEARPGEILISQTTYNLVKDHIVAQHSESRAIRGRAEPVMVYTLQNSPVA